MHYGKWIMCDYTLLYACIYHMTNNHRISHTICKIAAGIDGQSFLCLRHIL